MSIPLNLRTSEIFSQLSFCCVCIFIIFLGIPAVSSVPSSALCIAGLLTVFFSEPFEQRKLNGLIAILALFIGSSIVSTYMSVDVKRSMGFNLFLIPGLLLLFMITTITDMRKIGLLYFAFVILGILISFTALWGWWVSHGTGDPGTWIKHTGNVNLVVPNDLILLAVVMPLAFYGLIIIKQPVIQSFCCFSILLSVCVIVLYQSRGAMLLMCSNLIFFLWLRKSKPLLLYVLSIGIVVFCIDWFNGFVFLSKFQGTWNARLQCWIIALNMFFDAPFLGHGAHSYAVLYTEYRNALVLPEWIANDPRFMPWAHNLYLELLAEQGLWGLTSFLGLIGYCLVTAVATLKRATGVFKTTLICFFVSFFNLLLAGVFELSFIRHWVVILFFSHFGMAISLSYIIETKE